MTVFSKAAPEFRSKPAGHVTLPPSAFCPAWKKAPGAPVKVGITRLSEGDLEASKVSAAREAWQAFPRDVDAEMRRVIMNDLLVRSIVARGTCSPDDASEPFELWMEAPEEIVRDALTPEGAKAVFDAIDRVGIEMSPVCREADDTDIQEMSSMAKGLLRLMPKGDERRVRRLLGFCFDAMLDAKG